MKWHHRNGINVTFQVVFWLKGSCILKPPSPHRGWSQCPNPCFTNDIMNQCHVYLTVCLSAIWLWPLKKWMQDMHQY